jgi:hypothetical protein
MVQAVIGLGLEATPRGGGSLSNASRAMLESSVPLAALHQRQVLAAEAKKKFGELGVPQQPQGAKVQQLSSPADRTPGAQARAESQLEAAKVLQPPRRGGAAAESRTRRGCWRTLRRETATQGALGSQVRRREEMVASIEAPGGGPARRLSGLQHIKALGSAATEPLRAPDLQRALLACLSDGSHRVREAAFELVPHCFHFLPVRPAAERLLAGPGGEAEAGGGKAMQEQRRRDEHLLSQLMRLADPHQDPALLESAVAAACAVLSVSDRARVAQLAQLLRHPQARVRLVTARSLAALCHGRGCREVFHALLACEHDSDWCLRAALADVLPQVAGLAGPHPGEGADLERWVASERTRAEKRRATEARLHRRAGKASAGAGAGGASAQALEEMSAAERRGGHSEVAQGSRADSRLRAAVQLVMARSRRMAAMSARAVAALERMTENDVSWNVRRAALLALARHAGAVRARGRGVTRQLLRRLCDRSEEVRVAALEALPLVVDRASPEFEAVVAALLEAFTHPGAAPAEAGLHALHGAGGGGAGVLLHHLSKEEKATVRRHAVATAVSIAGVDHPLLIQGFIGLLSAAPAAGNSNSTAIVDAQRAALQHLTTVTTPLREVTRVGRNEGGGGGHGERLLACVLNALLAREPPLRHAAAAVLAGGQLLVGQHIHVETFLLKALSAPAAPAAARHCAISVRVALAAPADQAALQQQLKAIAFGVGGASGGAGDKDGDKALEPLAEEEWTLLQGLAAAQRESHGEGHEVVATGLCYQLEPGALGLEVSNWARRLLLLCASGELLCYSPTGEDQVKLIGSGEEIVNMERAHFGSVMPHALRLETRRRGGDGSRGSRGTLGFLVAQELQIWHRDLRDLAARQQLAAQRREEQRQAEEARAGPVGQVVVEAEAAGALVARLQEHFEAVERPQARDAADAELLRAKAELRAKLARMMTSRALFVEFAEGLGKGKEAGGKAKRRAEPKMDISELMALLKHESLYGGAHGVNAKQVHDAWKRANDDGDGVEAGQKDQDKLQLDWDEYQVCIHILAANLGVRLQPLRTAPAPERCRCAAAAEAERCEARWNYRRRKGRRARRRTPGSCGLPRCDGTGTTSRSSPSSARAAERKDVFRLHPPAAASTRRQRRGVRGLRAESVWRGRGARSSTPRTGARAPWTSASSSPCATTSRSTPALQTRRSCP